MKKILIILLLCFSCQEVYAKPYYSGYSNFSDYQEEEIISTDTIKVEEKEVYQWYKEEKLLGDYYFEGENNSEYPSIDKNDYINTEWTDWKRELPSYKKNRNIRNREVFMYQEISSIRYLKLKPLDKGFFISEIELYIDGLKIDYELICEDCREDFYGYISNGIYDEKEAHLNKNSTLFIDLKDYYQIDQFELVLYVDDNNQFEIGISLAVMRELGPSSKEYANKDIVLPNDDPSHHYQRYEFNFDHLDLFEPEYGEIKYDYVLPISRTVKRFSQGKAYSYQDVLYRYYKVIPKYMDGYSESPPKEYPLKGTSKKLYRYQTRDKVVISDELLITDKKTTLKDFILESTTDNIKITSNLNLNENGVYKVNYILPFKTVTKDVTVDIKDNLINALNYKIKENKDLKKKVNELNKTINNQYINIKEILIEKDELVTKLNNDLLTLRLKNEELKENKKTISSNIVFKKDMVFNKTILFIYLLIILIMMVVMKLKYKSKI